MQMTVDHAMTFPPFSMSLVKVDDPVNQAVLRMLEFDEKVLFLCACVCVCVCMRAYVRVCVSACACACVCGEG